MNGYRPPYGPPNMQRSMPVRPAAPFPVYAPNYAPPYPTHTVVRSPEPIAPRGGSGMPVLEIERPLSGAYPTNLGTGLVLSTPGADVAYDANGVKLGQPLQLLSSPNGQECAIGESLILTLGLLPRPQLFTAEDVDAVILPRATVRYGEGAVQAEFQCDFLNGTQIAVGARNLEVTAQVRVVTAPSNPETFEAPPDFDVKAMVSYGSLNQNSHGARLTDFVASEDGEDTVTLRVPAFAASFTVIPFGGIAWTASLYGMSTALVLPYSGGGGPIDATTYNVENSFPIPDGMFFLDVTNGGESALLALVVWDLVF